MSVLRPDLMMKCVIPVIMAGIIAVSVVFAFDIMSSLTSISPDLRSRRIRPHFRQS